MAYATWPRAYYLHWLFALAEVDLRYITDEFASKMAFSLSVLHGRHDDLAADLESGRSPPSWTSTTACVPS